MHLGRQNVKNPARGSWGRGRSRDRIVMRDTGGPRTALLGEAIAGTVVGGLILNQITRRWDRSQRIKDGDLLLCKEIIVNSRTKKQALCRLAMKYKGEAKNSKGARFELWECPSKHQHWRALPEARPPE